MHYLELERARLSTIGLGTWQFGSREWGYGPAYAGETAARIVNRALDLGVTLLDTAEIYGLGASERILGAAIRGRRELAFVATKLMPVLPLDPVVGWRARASARRLGVSTIDLYQLHIPNPLVPLAAQMGAMRRLVREGLVRHVGVSNFPLDRWRAAEAALGAPVLSNQVRVSLLDRGPLRDVVPYAQRAGRVVIAYSPLAQGLLTGRYGPDRRPSGGVRRFNADFSGRRLAALGELGDSLRQVARGLGATPSQVALAWVIRHPNVVAIPGASSVAQMEENAAAADLRLSDAEVQELEAAADRFSFGIALPPPARREVGGGPPAPGP
jgi:aryl-alcohol dehydrogenase-like predicted oxidoreductase